MIERLQISHLRNLTQVSLQSAACNVIIGANGSGKTSLLEAIFLLSRGKVFVIISLNAIFNTIKMQQRCMLGSMIALP